MTSFEHTGFWWDPRDPETKWPGTLRYGPVDGAALTLTIQTGPANWFAKTREYDILLGTSTGGQKITLLKCCERSSLDIFANSVIVGMHAEQPDPSISVAAAVIQHLDVWWGQAAIKIDPTKHPDLELRYEQPEPVIIHEDSEFRISICSALTGSHEAMKHSVTEEIRIELKAMSPQPLSAFQSRIHACQDLLSIACMTLCKIEDLRVSPAEEGGGQAREIGHYYAVPIFKDPSEPSSWPDMLVRGDDIRDRAREVFGAWLGVAQKLTTARSLYFSAAYGKTFLELKFLALAQAAEAYHRRAYMVRTCSWHPMSSRSKSLNQ